MGKRASFLILGAAAVVALLLPMSAAKAGTFSAAGTWSATRTGAMAGKSTITFVQKGFWVSGKYGKSGQLSGTLKGYALTGTWKEPKGSGWVKLTFSADGETFSGTYGSTKGKADGMWTGATGGSMMNTSKKPGH